MNASTSFLLATGFASLMGLTLMTPAAYAQDAGAPKDMPPMADDNGGQRGDHGAKGDDRGEHRARPGAIAGLICGTDGATRLETKFTDLATALKLTTTQQPLFDAYKTAALSAQATFAASCPQPAAAATAGSVQPTPPDAVTMMKDRVARDTAELDALNAVLPSFEALYASLDDTQKPALMSLVGPHGPRGDDRDDRGDDRRDDRAGRHDDRGDDDHSDEPGRGNEPGRGGDKGRH